MKDEVTIQCDSSQFGLGEALLQNGQTVAFSSRALIPAEQRYAQIEKECLAIVFACERFHQYVLGRATVTVQSDHRPLESVFTKPLVAAPARLQRMLLHLQKYNLDVQYVPGKNMFIADTLSRASLTENTDKSSFINPLGTVNYRDTMMVSSERLEKFKIHTAEDENL